MKHLFSYVLFLLFLILPSIQQSWFTLEELISPPKDITTSQIEAIKLNEQSMYGDGKSYVVGEKKQIATKTRVIATNRSGFVSKNTSIIEINNSIKKGER